MRIAQKAPRRGRSRPAAGRDHLVSRTAHAFRPGTLDAGVQGPSSGAAARSESLDAWDRPRPGASPREFPDPEPSHLSSTTEATLESSQLARFEAVVLPHLNAAYTLARYLMRNDDDAQDVAQEALLRALKYFNGFRGGDPRSWVLAIVRNTCRSWHRTRRPDALAVEFDEELHSEAAAGDQPDAALLRAASQEMVQRAIAELPLALREVIVLREIEGLSYKEIADVADIPLGTVMSRLSRARERLQGALGGAKQRGG